MRTIADFGVELEIRLYLHMCKNMVNNMDKCHKLYADNDQCLGGNDSRRD